MHIHTVFSMLNIPTKLKDKDWKKFVTDNRKITFISKRWFQQETAAQAKDYECVIYD